MSAKPKTAVFEPFSWLSDDAKRYPMAVFVERAHDMAAGLALALEMVESAELNRMDPDAYDGEVPVLDGCDTFIMLRFAIAAARSMHELAGKEISWLNEYGAKAVRQGTVSALP